MHNQLSKEKLIKSTHITYIYTKRRDYYEDMILTQ